MNLDAIYYMLLATFFTHELDAVKRHEWRVLPLIRALPEWSAEQVFIWAHVPIFLAILWFGEGETINPFRQGLATFSVAHVALHWLFRRHPAYEFNNPNSWGLIILSGALGAAYLLVSLT